MELPKNVAVQDLECQVLKEKCRVSELWWMPSLDNHVHLCSRLGKPSHESSYLGLMFQFFTPKSFKTWKAKSWIVQSLSRLGDMELPKNVAVQDLECQVLKEKCRVSELWWMPSLDNHVHLCSRLGKPSHESSYLGLMFQFFTPKSLKTWKAKSWIVQSLSRLGDMELPKNVVQDLECQVLKEKCKVSELWWMPSLDNHVHLCSRLGKPSHESSYMGLMFQFFTPKKFEDLESQVLNSAIIVKTWGHGVAQKCSSSRLGMPSLERKM